MLLLTVMGLAFLVIGVLSWIPAMLLALPLSMVPNDLIGRSMLS